MTEVFQQLSDTLAATIEAVSPSIVRVEARRRFPATGMGWTRDRVLVTGHPVIEQDDNIRLGLHGGQTATATLVGRDPTTDLAVLRATTQELVPPVWAEPDGASLRLGHLALALGRPGRSVQATLGMVSVR